MAYISNNTWTIDGSISLTKVCKDADWHLQTTIDSLIGLGLTREDATAFANFAFIEDSTARGGRADCKAEDCLSDAQWDRLA